MKITNGIFTGAANRKSLIDLALPHGDTTKIVLFIHGYKGYKDWGAWNLAADFFLNNNIGFAKFNLSHNGGSVNNPIDFPDLDAFGKNRYSYELTDIEKAIEWIKGKVTLADKELILIGHSRGGAIALLSGILPAVSRVITWASIADIASRFPKGEELEKWRKNGVRYVKNARTNQEMPHDFSFYEDFKANEERLTIQRYAELLKSKNKRCLHIHGADDEAVSVEAVHLLASWTGGQKVILDNTGHTFDTKHPWEKQSLPEKMEQVCRLSVEFIIDNQTA